MNYISFFSGALGLDLGFEEVGFSPLLYCEFDKKCQQTINKNKPEVPLITDIRDYDAKKVISEISKSSKSEVELIIGGPPCQAFSTAGARKSFDDERGNVFLHFLKIATDINPKYIVIENVRGLLSAVYSHKEEETGEVLNGKGSALDFIIKYLEEKGYGVTFNLYNSANYGVPQIRERVVIIACRDGYKMPYLEPTHSQNGEHGLLPWKTLREAIGNINKENNKLCATFPEKRLRYYRLLKSGQNWKNLPEELQKEAMGKSFYLGGGKTGFLRRLSWDKPSPTLVTSPTMPATDLAHPDEDRPLSVAEYARIQQFPENWFFAGNITDQYKQIGNAVPIGLGKAIASLIMKHSTGSEIRTPADFKYSRYKFTTEKDWMEAFNPKKQYTVL